MLKRIAASALLVTGMCLSAGNAMAGPLGTELQTLLNSKTVGGTSSVNVNADFLSDQSDSYWTLGADGQDASVSTMVFEFQGTSTNDYTFGVFDWASGTTLNLFTNAADVGKTVTLTIDGMNFKAEAVGNTTPFYASATFSSTTFGYFFETGNGTVYSDSSKNGVNQDDHMLAYQGKGDYLNLNGNTPQWTASSYVLAFEEAAANWNYTDLVVLVNNVSPAPEPATLVLLGTGVAGLTGMVRRRKEKNRYNFNK